MILEYSSGMVEALGKCYSEYHSEMIAHPSALWFRRMPNEGLVLWCSAPSTVYAADGFSWEVLHFQGRIAWWFNDQNDTVIKRIE